ncbi:MAG TPA: [LysW]-aminoadipate kinase [archaeon]|nr:[LysW]-aminoadipate kinase [archaeon]
MIILKVGGGKSVNLDGITSDVASLAKSGEKFIIVHGANFARDELSQRLGVEKRVVTSVSGYDSVYSDETAIDLLMMAYAGVKNKRLVELLQKKGVNAIGLSGLDGRVIQGKRNNGIRVIENGKQKILRDFSGKPQSVNKELLELLLGNGFTPVLCMPIADENGFAINSENDDVVRVLQESMKAEKIVSLIEEKGFLEEKNNPNSLVKKISKGELAAREQRVEGRMKRKVLALRQLLEGGAATVMLGDGRTEHPVLDALN